MEKNTRSLRLLVVAGVLSTLSACAPFAQTPSVEIPVWVQPSVDISSFRERLAVVPFQASGGNVRDIGSAVTSELETALLSAKLPDGSPYFVLVSRTALDKVLSEIQFGQTGFAQEETVARLGQLLGAKAVLYGDYTLDFSQNKRVEYTRYGSVELCEVNLIFTMRPRIIEVATGRIVYGDTISKRFSSSSCAYYNNISEVRQLAIRQASQEMVRKIAPYLAYERIPFIENVEGMPKEVAQLYLRGLDFVRVKPVRLDRACEIWTEALRMAPANPTLLYSLGVCAEANGDLKKAQDLYKQADRLVSSPNPVISSALLRIERKLAQGGQK